MTDRPGSTASLRAGLFLISAATLTLEILQTRIFSVLLWHHVTYVVVTLTLLGFTVAGAWLTVFPGCLEPRRAPRTLAWSCLLFALSAIAALLAVSHQSFDSSQVLQNKWTYFLIAGLYGYLVIPYFFAGLAITATLSLRGGDVGKLYFVNLVGSALGCWLLVLLLTPLGGERMVFFCAALGCVAAFFYAARGTWLRSAALALLFVLSWLGAVADQVLPLGTAPDKLGSRLQSAQVDGKPFELLSSRWSPLCRIDVYGVPGGDQYVVCQDGDAPTTMRCAESAAEEEHLITPYALGYRLFDGEPRRPDVLIIGPGGGPDIVQALRNDAGSITAVEINGVTAGLMRGKFSAYTGGLYTRPGVEVHVAEGRSFLRRSRRRFDLIQMTGTDTYAALSSGAYVMSESYLYTKEAFRDYFDHLSEDGVVAVLRFRFDPPRESLRLFAIALEALRERGAARPSEHAVVIENEVIYPFASVAGGRSQVVKYAVLLFKLRPFTSAQIARYIDYVRERSQNFLQTGAGTGAYLLGYAPEGGYAQWKRAHPGVEEELKKGFSSFLQSCCDILKGHLHSPLEGELAKFRPLQEDVRRCVEAGGDLAAYLRHAGAYLVYPDRSDDPLELDGAYLELARAIDAGEQAAFYAGYPYLVDPVSDDRPFFFKYHRWSHLWGSRVEKPGYEAIYGAEPIGLFILLALLIETSAAALLLVVLPLLVVRRDSLRGHGSLRSFIYFAGLGAGFILLEVAYLQKFVLFLGHPVYSLTVTLSSFLFFAGLGSLISRRFQPRAGLIRTAVVGIVVLIALYAFALAPIFQAFLERPAAARIAIAIALLAPLNLLMGIPFPTGIRILQREAPRFIPWAFGVNGAASVVGSILCIILALALGFQIVALLAAGIYLAAALIFTAGRGAPA